MSELTKMMAAAGLLVAGFFSATLFGVPDRLDSHPPSAALTPMQLEPIDSAEAMSSLTMPPPTWEPNVSLATHTDNSATGEYQVNRAELSQTSSDDRRWPTHGITPERQTTLVRGSLRGMAPLPEIRRAAEQRPSLHPLPRESPRAIPPTNDRFASLSPPALLPANKPPLQFPEAPLITSIAPSNSGGSWLQPSPADSASSESWIPPAPMPTNQERMSPNRVPLDHALDQAIAHWHVVSDGDSLIKLAAHYLRDETRAADIYDLNRDVLNNPQLLPIGVELRIPERGSTLRAGGSPNTFGRTSSPRSGSEFDRTDRQRTGSQGFSRMAPLPVLPANVVATPRARLQRPVAASFAGGN